MGSLAATRGPFGTGAFPGLEGPPAWPSELGRKSETSLWKYPLRWKLWRCWGRGSRGRFLQGLRRAEVGAGGQKETAPGSGTRGPDGGKEGKKERRENQPCCCPVGDGAGSCPSPPRLALGLPG